MHLKRMADGNKYMGYAVSAAYPHFYIMIGGVYGIISNH